MLHSPHPRCCLVRLVAVPVLVLELELELELELGLTPQQIALVPALAPMLQCRKSQRQHT